MSLRPGVVIWKFVHCEFMEISDNSVQAGSSVNTLAIDSLGVFLQQNLSMQNLEARLRSR
jgi:hypothetical protein